MDVTNELTDLPGWRVLTSDAGRLWATRVRPFSVAAQKRDAYRTVDADDEDTLRSRIAEMERLGGEAGAARDYSGSGISSTAALPDGGVT